MIASSFHMLQTRTNKTTWLKWLRHIVRTMQNGQGMDHESLYFEGWSVFRHLLSVQLGKMRAASTSCFRLISEESKHVNLFLIFSLFGPDSKPSKGNINSGSDLGKLQKNHQKVPTKHWTLDLQQPQDEFDATLSVTASMLWIHPAEISGGSQCEINYKRIAAS